MEIQKCFLGQLLSLLTVLKIHLHTRKYDPSNVSPPFFIDTFFAPLLTFLVVGLLKTKINKKIDVRIYFGSLLDSFFYYYTSYELEIRFANSCESVLMAYDELSYLVCMIFTYLVSERFPKNIPHFIVYIIILMSSVILAQYEKDIFFILRDHYIGLYGISVLLIPSHYVLLNIITNEAGIINYLFLQCPAVVLLLVLHFWGIKQNGISLILNAIQDSLGFYILYLMLTLLVTIGTVLYTQTYGILSMGLISVTNFVLYRFITMFSTGVYNFPEIFILAILYVVFIVTSLGFTKNRRIPTYNTTVQ